MKDWALYLKILEQEKKPLLRKLILVSRRLSATLLLVNVAVQAVAHKTLKPWLGYRQSSLKLRSTIGTHCRKRSWSKIENPQNQL